MKKISLVLATLLVFQVGCGRKGITTQNLSSAPTPQSASDINNCISCAVSMPDINVKIAATNTALADATALLGAIDGSAILTNPTSVTSSKVLDTFVSKVNDLMSKIDSVKAQIDADVAALDPVKDSSIIAQLQAAKTKLIGIQGDVLKARDQIVAKLDQVVSKIEAAIAKLPVYAQVALALTGIQTKIESFFTGARAALEKIVA